MRRTHTAAVALSSLLAACAHTGRDSRAVVSKSPVSPAAPGPAAAEPAPTVESQVASQPPSSSGTLEGPAVNAPAPATAARTAPVAPEPPGQSAPGTSNSRPSQQATGPKNAPVSPVPATAAALGAAAPSKASTPSLDLKGLEQRLRDTRAIGVFTKLSLKNQMDELLAQFRAFHQGKPGVTVGQLRQKYELLLMKVVTLLQDGDPALASAVSSSREAIWDVLTDPQKFAAIAYST
jgi:hypothetical protein